MDDVRGDFLGPPYGITSAAVIAYKNKRTNGPVNAHLRSASYTNTILKADEPLGSIFSESLNFSPTANFLQGFHLK